MKPDRMRTIPMALSSDHPFSVSVWSGDGDRFAQLFVQAWQRIPEEVRTKILHHWTEENSLPVLVELSNIWKNHKKRLAEVSRRGYTVKFNAEEFDGIPVPVAECTIAHELAHVYQYACGLITGTDDDERGVRDLVAKWGFDWIAEMNWRAARLGSVKV